MALFIFHGASRDEQVGVKAKPSPAVAKMTALLKRAMRKRRRVKPAALEPVENLKPAATMAPAAQPLADAAPVSVAAYPPQEKAEAPRATATTHNQLVLQSCTADDFDALDVDSDDEGGAVHPERRRG